MNQKQYDVRDKIEHEIIKVYRYGSRVYRCHQDNSDYDFIVVVRADEDLYYGVGTTANVNFTVYSESMFIKKIKEHHISIMECIFQSEDDPYVKYFELNKSQLRRAIRSVSSNSYVKCKKKLAQGDDYIGKKSLFHSLRILNFGIQIALYGKIVDYASANVFHKMIFEMSNDWVELDYKFKPIYNSMSSVFKKLAPLEEEENEA